MSPEQFERWRKGEEQRELRVRGALFIATGLESEHPPVLYGEMWRSDPTHPCGGHLEDVQVRAETIMRSRLCIRSQN
jgi:hypothetical protein